MNLRDIKFPKLTGNGKANKFCEEYTYLDLSTNVKPKDAITTVKTIHKAKGDEFENVHLLLKEESALEFILTPDIISDNKEQHRIHYVAISRAKQRLFITVPELSVKNKHKIDSVKNSIGEPLMDVRYLYPKGVILNEPIYPIKS